MTLIIRNENDKPYLHVLRHLFEMGDEEEIKNYILSFDEDDPDYDIFLQKLQDFVKNDNLDVIEEMIYDEDLIVFSRKINEGDSNFDEEEYEQYLYTGNHEEDDPLEEIPNEEDDDLEYKESKDPKKDLLDYIGGVGDLFADEMGESSEPDF